MEISIIDTYVCEIRESKRPDKKTVTVSYKYENIENSFALEASISEANKLWIGQKISILIFLG